MQREVELSSSAHYLSIERSRNGEKHIWTIKK